MPASRTTREVLVAGALLAGVAAGAQLLAGEVRSPGGWSYAAAALGCAHAAVLGAVTIAIGRRATAVAWAPALLWPLAGPAPAAAALAALVGALVLAQRLGAHGRVLSAALAAGALAVFVGARRRRRPATPRERTRSPRTPRATWPAATPRTDATAPRTTRPAATMRMTAPRASTMGPAGTRPRRAFLAAAPPRRGAPRTTARSTPAASEWRGGSCPPACARPSAAWPPGAPASPRRDRAARTA